ncbi:hypothetical protein [Empedobacter sp. UBA6322]|nr:hypothetical protein [Empedobacter sp. UBA6322]
MLNKKYSNEVACIFYLANSMMYAVRSDSDEMCTLSDVIRQPM